MNTSSGLTVLYDVLKASISDGTKRVLAEDFDRVLSLNLLQPAQEEAAVDADLEAYVLSRIAERNAARKEKNFGRADEIRQELAERGITIKDTREGTTWQKN